MGAGAVAAVVAATEGMGTVGADVEVNVPVEEPDIGPSDDVPDSDLVLQHSSDDEDNDDDAASPYAKVARFDHRYGAESDGADDDEDDRMSIDDSSSHVSQGPSESLTHPQRTRRTGC